MENSEARAVRRVRCPRCHCVLEEPSAPVYQCGGCGTNLRAKNRTGTGTGTGSAGDVAMASPSRTGLPPQTSDVASTSRSSTQAPTPPRVGSTSRSGTPPTPPSPHVGTASWHQATTTDATGSRHRSGDLGPVSAAGPRASGGDVKASTSSPPPRDATASTNSRRQEGADATSRRGESGGLVSDATTRSRGSGNVSSSTPEASSGRQGADTTTSRRESGGPVPPARNRVSEQVALIETRGRGQGARDAGGATESVHGGARLSGDATPESGLQDDTEEGMKRQAEPTDCQELVPKSAQAQPAPAAQPAREDDDDDAGEKAAATSPSRHENEQEEEEHLGPLRKRILKTVDELKGDLSELFSKSPELNGTRARRPPRLPSIPKQQGHVSLTPAAGSGFPARETRHTAAAAAAATGDGHRGHHHGSAARAVTVRKPRQAAAAAPPPPPRGLPSRRYRQCRAYSSSSCHHGHGCCGHHGKPVPECSSCRGYCCRPTRAPAPAAAAAGREKEPSRRRRLPPRNHCRPVLKGAPFIVCSSCFTLVQVPADFAVSVSTRMTVRRLRCGSCSAVLSYSYRDPARKKQASYQDSMDRSSEQHERLDPDPFAPFVDAFGLSSYSTTEDEQQRLPVSRNTSLDTLDGGARGVGRLHRLMGYGSASELMRHSPDLYESFSERTTPDLRQHDTKGKGVCIDDDDGDDDYDVDDSDEEDVGGALKRSAGKGSGWPLAWIPGKGTPAAGAIRIK